jgi:hypothetical protein
MVVIKKLLTYFNIYGASNERGPNNQFQEVT